MVYKVSSEGKSYETAIRRLETEHYILIQALKISIIVEQIEK